MKFRKNKWGKIATNTRLTFLLLLVISVINFATAQQQPNTGPNIVLIVADNMGYADIGPYGATDVQTPALNKLAREGVRFSNYYSAAPVCSPSRAALLSGHYPAKVGVERNAGGGVGLLAKYDTLVRELKKANYQTAAVGKWHLGQSGSFGPNAHGFDSFLGFHTWTIGYHTHNTQSGSPGLYRDDNLVSMDGYLTDILSNEAVQFINAQKDGPFFLYLAYNTQLPPYQKPDLPKSEWRKGWDVSEADRSDVVAMIESMDKGIGLVLAALENKGIADNTLVVFTHDHGGEELARSGSLSHGFATLWEGGIRVPLILHWPQHLESNQKIDRPTIAMDVTATLLDAANVDTSAFDLDGASLFPIIEDPTNAAERTLFWRFGSGGGAMKAAREGKWKLVIEQDAELLFDLESDIGEKDNISKNNDEIFNKLKNGLNNWEQSLKILP